MAALPSRSVSTLNTSAEKKWKMPFPVFTGASQLEVITVIANCGDRTELATGAVYKWIQAKQMKGRTLYEILGKLELLENKFVAFASLHECFHSARRATGLPPSRILSGGVGLSTPRTLAPLPEESVLDISEQAESSTTHHIDLDPLDLVSPSSESERVEHSSTPPGHSSSESEALDFESKRPPPLRLRTLLDARRARMGRRHSIHISSQDLPQEEDLLTPTFTRRSHLTITLRRRRSSVGSGMIGSSTPNSSFEAAWPTPAVALDPPAAPSLSYDDSSPDSIGEVHTPTSRPSTSADSYYSTVTRAPSVTSFRILDSVRHSVQAKFDPELAETLFHGSTAQNFLRIFRPEA